MVARRRIELQLEQYELANLAGVGRRTVATFESGDSWPRTPTQHRLEAALGWPPGTIAAAREGAAPLEPPTVPAVAFAELDDATLWELIEAGHLDARRRREAIEVYERRQVDLLAQRLGALSRRGLMATSKYVAILLEIDPSEGFRRSANEFPWGATGT